MMCLKFHLFSHVKKKNLFRILYRRLIFIFFSLMKVKTIKFIQCGPCFINAPIFFEIFYIAMRHLDFVTFIHWKFDPRLCLLNKKIVQGLIKNVYTNQTFNMNVPLSYNNIFKWGGPLGIRSLTIFFGTPTMLWP
jgi:hypothetical protein